MAEVTPVDVHRIKEPLLAALLTFLMSGLGQIYNGQVKKGIAFFALDIAAIFALVFVIMFGSVIAAVLTFWAGGAGMCCCFPLMFLAFAWRVYFAYDAYQTAVKINNGEPVYDWFN